VFTLALSVQPGAGAFPEVEGIFGISITHILNEFQGHHTNQAYYKSGIMSSEYPATDSFDIDVQALRHGNPAIVISTCCHELPPKLRHDRLLCES